MTKYIFITGGVISSLGKGVTTASLAAILKARGIKVSVVKIDGYLNIDAGLMSPYEHGEVFVTSDGGETDLDLGNYERFIDAEMTKDNNITSGKIYQKILSKERRGEYLGKTVQYNPHVTDEIKDWLKRVGKPFDILLVEIGGIVGDFESMPFIEAARQMNLEDPKNCLFIHLALLLFVDYINENKTKPIQHSVKTMVGLGIQPNIIVCRISSQCKFVEIAKIARHTNIPEKCLFVSRDVDHKYIVPLMLHKQGLDTCVLNFLGLYDQFSEINMEQWSQLTLTLKNRNSLPKLKLAFVRKYIVNDDNYVSLIEALHHSALSLGRKLELVYVDSEEKNMYEKLDNCDCILIPGGWGARGTETKINAVTYAREKKIPFFGICYGFQLAVVEYGRSILKLEDCYSKEVKEDCKNPVIEEINFVIKEEKQDEGFNFPRKLRIGSRKIHLKKGTKIREYYGDKEFVNERYRHRYSFNLNYKKQFENHGLVFCAQNEDDNENTQECLELDDHPFFMAVQYHPEFLSRPFKPHPLLTAFLKAGVNNK